MALALYPLKQWSSAASNNWCNYNPIFVKYIVVNKCLGEIRAAKDIHVTVTLRFQFGNF